jgi:hypothetical protein
MAAARPVPVVCDAGRNNLSLPRPVGTDELSTRALNYPDPVARENAYLDRRAMK